MHYDLNEIVFNIIDYLKEQQLPFDLAMKAVDILENQIVLEEF